jgi:hypothetical protein
MTVSVEMQGLEQTIAMLKKRSRALTNLTPAYKTFAAEIVKKTDDAFQNERGYDGEAWDKLAESTILSRISAVGAANKYTASSTKKVEAMRAANRGRTASEKSTAKAKLVAAGWTAQQAHGIVNFGHTYEVDSSGRTRKVSKQLTKGAARKRELMLAPGGIKPLIDTARARNSNHATADRNGVEWSAVGYLGVHMAGTNRAGRGHSVTIPMRNPSPFVLAGDDWKLRESARKSLEEHIKRHVFSKGGGEL